VRFDLAPERRTKAAQAAIQQATISPALERQILARSLRTAASVRLRIRRLRRWHAAAVGFCRSIFLPWCSVIAITATESYNPGMQEALPTTASERRVSTGRVGSSSRWMCRLLRRPGKLVGAVGEAAVFYKVGKQAF